MDKTELESQVRSVIEDYLRGRGMELVDLICRHEGGDLFLRILADRLEGGINLGECASINREIGCMLDERDILRERYVLEVSSPGLDRPLGSKADFLRCLNKKAKFFLKEPVNGKLEWDGVIIKADDISVYADIGGDVLEISLASVTKAKLLF